MNHKKLTKRAPSLQATGKRKQIIPLRLAGYFARERQRIAWLLMAIFLIAPWVSLNERHLIRFDFNNDMMWFGFSVWHQTDAFYFLAIPLLLVLVLFLSTTLKGRIWCGYACPQTVFLDWLVRPIEEFFEGDAYAQIAASKRPVTWSLRLRKLAKHACFVLCGLIVGNTCLAYIFGPYTILSWMQSAPSENPYAFLSMLFITGLFYFDFAWFREQFCSFLCPYARFQAVLMDEASPSVYYHSQRGEPRSKKATGGTPRGDCIDCGLCVRVCPTGIDIRDGLQLECIQCFRCVDACNRVMKSLDRPTRLIDFVAAKPREGRWSFRVIVYSTLIAIICGITVFGWINRPQIEVTVMRQARSAVARYDDGRIANFFTLRISNTTGKEQPIKLVSQDSDVTLVCGQCEVALKPYETRRAMLIAVFAEDFTDKQVTGRLHAQDYERSLIFPLLKTRTQEEQ